MTRGHYLRLMRDASQYTGEKHCNRCGACCMAGPCQLKDMGDVVRLAAHLGLTVPETINRHLNVEQGVDGACVVPKRKEDRSCSFYDDATRSCGVQEAKPTGGQLYECWTIKGSTLTPLYWDGHALRELQRAGS